MKTLQWTDFVFVGWLLQSWETPSALCWCQHWCGPTKTVCERRPVFVVVFVWFVVFSLLSESFSVNNYIFSLTPAVDAVCSWAVRLLGVSWRCHALPTPCRSEWFPGEFTCEPRVFNRKKGLKKEEVVKQEGTRLKLILCVHVCVCGQTNVLHYFNRFNDKNTSLKLN